MRSKLKGGMAAAAFLLVALLAITPKANAGDLMYGDANLNGAVDISDRLQLAQAANGVAAVVGNADATGDCSISVADNMVVAQNLAGLRTDLPAISPPSCWAVSLTEPPVIVIVESSTAPVTVSLSNNPTPPRGGLTCEGVTVDFADISLPAGCSLLSSSAVTDAACNATVILAAGAVTGMGEIAVTVNLVNAIGGPLTLISTAPGPVEIEVIPSGPQTPDAIAISAPTQTDCQSEEITISLTAGGAGVPGEAANITCTGEVDGPDEDIPIPGGSCDFADGGNLQTICGANWNSTGASELDTTCGEITFGTDQGCYGASGASYHMQDTDNSSLITALDTTGLSGIKVSYCRATDGVDGGVEGLWIEWYDGAGWNCISDHHCDVCGTNWGVGSDGWPNDLMCGDGIGQTEWANTGCGQITLPAGAEDNSNFQLRFRCDTSGASDDCFVDAIVVTYLDLKKGPVSFTAINDVSGGYYTTDASITAGGPSTIICTWDNGVDPPVSDQFNIEWAETFDTTPPGNLAANPPGGEYCSTQSVALSSDDLAATIYYTLTGADPTTSSPVYSAPIAVGEATLKFIAVDTCGNQSGIATEVYTYPAGVNITKPPDGITILESDCVVEGTAGTDISTVTVDGTDEPVSGGKWTHDLLPCPMSLGSKTINASAIDTCGIPVSDSVTVWVTGTGCPREVAGSPQLIQSLPREDASNLPPDSVTKNMPVDAYLKFVYNETMDISSADDGGIGGTFSRETTNYGYDTVVWSAALAYSTGPITLTITGVVDCDESNPATTIVLTLRTARDLTEPPGVDAQTGEGFLNGYLQVWVIDEFTGDVIQDAVVQLNTTTSTAGDGYFEEVDKTDASGYVEFIGTGVPLNVPVMLTVLAPEHQYLTFANLDARQVVMGLRLSGYGFTQKGDTQIIGDFPPIGYDNGVHPQICRNAAGEGSDDWDTCDGLDLPNPIRFGLASLGLYRRAFNTMVTQDVMAANVLQDLFMIVTTKKSAMPANILLPDFVLTRYDIPSGTGFVGEAFYRLGTRESGRNMYVQIGGGSVNIQSFDIIGLLNGSKDMIKSTASAPMVFSCGDIQRITVPPLDDIGEGPNNCQLIIVDDNPHGVTQDNCFECNQCTNVLTRGRQMDINNYNYGWSGNTATDTAHGPAHIENDFVFTQGAIRINMSNLAYDPDKDEIWSARVAGSPAIIPVLQLSGSEMDDGTIMSAGVAMCNRVMGGIASKVIGFPNYSAIESDLGLAPGTIKAFPNTQLYDWEVRFAASIGEPGAITPAWPPPVFETSEFLPLTRGEEPGDPLQRSGDREVHGYWMPVDYDKPGPLPTSPDNELADRLFEWWDITATGPDARWAVIDAGDDPVTPEDESGVDPEMNGDLVMMELIDRCSTDPTQVESGSNWGEDPEPTGSQNLGVWQNTPIEPSYSEIWTYDRDGGSGGPWGQDPVTPRYRPIANKLWRIYAPSEGVGGGKLSFYLPEVPTVGEISGMGVPGDFTFETLGETGLPDDYIMEWSISPMNVQTHVTMQNFITPADEKAATTFSQGRQLLIFQR